MTTCRRRRAGPADQGGVPRSGDHRSPGAWSARAARRRPPPGLQHRPAGRGALAAGAARAPGQGPAGGRLPDQGPAGRRRHRQHAHRLPPVPGRRAGRHRRRPAAGGGGTRRCWWSCCAARRATLDPSAALARYEAYRRSLRDELGTDPGAALQAVQQQLLQGSAPVVRHGVPHEPNPLVGRDDDITAVAGPLRSSRITSIVGTGGLGETRLAHAVSRRAEQRVVHFVALAGVAADDVQHHRVAERLAEPGRPDRRLGWRGGHTLPASTLWPWWPRHQQRAGGQVQPVSRWFHTS